MSLETTCPYCNARVDLPEPLLTGARIPCPRCGETFVPRVGSEEGALSEPHVAAPSPVAASPVVGKRWSNGAVAAAILGVMAAMAFLGLMLALQTEGIRRANDQKIVKPPVVSVPLLVKVAGNLWIVGLFFVVLGLWQRQGQEAVAAGQPRRLRWLMIVAAGLMAFGVTINLLYGPIRGRNTRTVPEPVRSRSVPPAQLEALGYLPDDTNLVVALHVADAVDNPAGKNWLAALRLGPIDLSAEQVEQWTGLKWDEIDHLIIGVRVDDRLIPHLLLVVRTLQPLDAVKIQKSLKATRLPEAHRYRFKLGRPPLEVALWCPDGGQTLIVALASKDLDAVPTTPRPGLARFSLPLQNLLQERLPRSALAWLAGHSEHWNQTLAQAWLLTLPQTDRQVLDRVQTFGLWLQLEPEPALGAAVRCADEPAGEALEKYLQAWIRKRLDHATFVRDGAWVTGQARGNADVLRQMLERP